MASNKIELKDIEITNAQAFEKGKTYLIEVQINVIFPRDVVQEFTEHIKNSFEEKGIDVILVLKYEDALNIKAIEINKSENN